MAENNFLVFNEVNNENLTMDDESYFNDTYRKNGLIPMIADPLAHNKMYRQWSIMSTAVANMISAKDYDATDKDVNVLAANLTSSVKDLSREELNQEIITLESLNGWKHEITASTEELNTLSGLTASTEELNTLSGITATTEELNTLSGLTASTEELNTLSGITATTEELNTLSGLTASTEELNALSGLTASTEELNTLSGLTASTEELNTLSGITATTEELNTLSGITASTEELNTLSGITVTTEELNTLSGVSSNVQQQINQISAVIASPFPAWTPEKTYETGDICIVSTFKSFQYLECVSNGMSGTTMPEAVDIGQILTDNEVKWLVCDFRDSSPVGAIRYDYLVRAGWVKCNGATLSGSNYPRLLNFLKDNNLATIAEAETLDDATTTASTNHNNEPGRFFLAYGTTENEYNIILPDFTGRFMQGSEAAGAVLEAGLPNITGSVGSDIFGIAGGGIFNGFSGAFYGTTKKTTYGASANTAGTNSNKYNDWAFSASLSNSIYGNSTTVQPTAVQMIPLIKY